jgi:hypothetical protein
MYFIKQGKTVFEARKLAMFIYALCVLPVVQVYALNDDFILFFKKNNEVTKKMAT